MKVSIKQGMEFRKLGNEGILLDTETCRFYRLSTEAVECWDRLSKGEFDQVEPLVLAEFHQFGLVEGDVTLGISPQGSSNGRHILGFDALAGSARTYQRVSLSFCTSKGGTWDDSSNGVLGDNIGTCSNAK